MTRTEARYVQLRAQLERAEHELMKAARKWDRLRQRVRRAERTLDKQFNQRAGGTLDWRELAEKKQ